MSDPPYLAYWRPGRVAAKFVARRLQSGFKRNDSDRQKK
jgi:hypothetical protein